MIRPAAGIAALVALLATGCAEMEASGAPDVSLPDLTWPTFGGAAGAEELESDRPPPLSEGDLPAPQTGEPVERVAIATAEEEVPAIYMALEPRRGRPVAVIFAIDSSNDQTPEDDPAIRIRPANGKCNPSELRLYRFAPEDRRPVFSRIQAVRGVAPADLPAFLATQVSARMIDQGLARDLEATKPQNVCTAKLWEGLVLATKQAANTPETTSETVAGQ